MKTLLYVCSVLAILANLPSHALAQSGTWDDPWNDPISDYYGSPPPGGKASGEVAIDLPYATVKGGSNCTTADGCDANGNFQITLDVWRPVGSYANTQYPALIYVHGGAFELNDKTVVTNFAQSFASQGMVVFVVNYRMVGSSNYSCNGTSCTSYPMTCGKTGGANAYTGTLDGKTYVNYLDYCQQMAKRLEDSATFHHPAAVQDIRQAIKFVHNSIHNVDGKNNSYHVDPTKQLSLYGTSAGAHLVMLAATDYEDALGGSGPDNARVLTGAYNVMPDVVVALSPVLDFVWAEGALAQSNASPINAACDTFNPSGNRLAKASGSGQCGVLYLDLEAGGTCNLPTSGNFWDFSSVGGDCNLGATSKHNLVSPAYNLATYAGTIQKQGVKMYTFNSEGEFLHFSGVGAGLLPGHGYNTLTNANAAWGSGQTQYRNCMMPFEVSGDTHVSYQNCRAGGVGISMPSCGIYSNTAWPSDNQCYGYDGSTVITVQDIVNKFILQGGF